MGAEEIVAFPNFPLSLPQKGITASFTRYNIGYEFSTLHFHLVNRG